MTFHKQILLKLTLKQIIRYVKNYYEPLEMEQGGNAPDLFSGAITAYNNKLYYKTKESVQSL